MAQIQAIFELVHGLFGWALALLVLCGIGSVFVFAKVFQKDFSEID